MSYRDSIFTTKHDETFHSHFVFPIEMYPSSKMCSSSQSSKRDKLKVRFKSDLVNDIGTEHATSTSPLLSDVDVTELWWSESELYSFQVSAALLQKEIVKHAKVDSIQSYGDILLNSFIRCACVDGPTPEQRHYFREWTRNAPSRRGIENLIVSELALIRNDSKKKYIQAVLIAQECSSNLCKDMKVEFIRSTSESRSLSARNFALMMGDADAYAQGCKIVTRRSSSTDMPHLPLNQKNKFEKKNFFLNIVRTVKRVSINKRISI
jgi:hypothetical protein